jgi:hypothetical protein
MTRSYTFSRKDGNHNELSQTYAELGCSCIDMSAMGQGFPDAVVGAAGITDLVEFKSALGELEPGQKRFHRDWCGSTIWIVRTREEVIAHVQHMRKRARMFRPGLPQ